MDRDLVLWSAYTELVVPLRCDAAGLTDAELLGRTLMELACRKDVLSFADCGNSVVAVGTALWTLTGVR